MKRGLLFLALPLLMFASDVFADPPNQQAVLVDEMCLVAPEAQAEFMVQLPVQDETGTALAAFSVSISPFDTVVATRSSSCALSRCNDGTALAAFSVPILLTDAVVTAQYTYDAISSDPYARFSVRILPFSPASINVKSGLSDPSQVWAAQQVVHRGIRSIVT